MRLRLPFRSTKSDTLDAVELVSRLSRSEALAELANLVEAVPAAFRAPVVHAALRLRPSGSFDNSYVIGTVRAQLYEALVDCVPATTAAQLRSLPRRCREQTAAILSRLAGAADLARVQLILCELLVTLVEALRASDPHRN